MSKTIFFKTIRVTLILAVVLAIATPVLAQGTVPPGGGGILYFGQYRRWDSQRRHRQCCL